MTGLGCGRRYASAEAAERAADLRNAKAGELRYAPGTCRAGSSHHHVIRVKATAQADTGPRPKVRAEVLARDGYACVRCARPCGPGIGPYSIQHRVARGVGGGNELSNLILLCGSATTLCHGQVEKRRPLENLAGYWLKSTEDPQLAPVNYADATGVPSPRWLADDGSFSFQPPGAAA